jgi:hypothetical protein
MGLRISSRRIQIARDVEGGPDVNLVSANLVKDGRWGLFHKAASMASERTWLAGSALSSSMAHIAAL